MSRELTIAWAKCNCPDLRVVKDVVLRLDEAKGRHIYLVVGRNLTRSKEAYLVISQRREMFAFELTPKQEANLDAHANALGALVQAKHEDIEADAPDDPIITIANLIIENADGLSGRETLSGQVEYQSSQPLLDGIAIRLMFQMPGGAMISHFHHPHGPLLGQGVLKFRMSPLLSDGVRELPKTLPVFVSFCYSTIGTAPRTLISNTCAALLDMAN